MIELPDDLVPLGIVHNEKSGKLMEAIENEHRSGHLRLWGYCGEHTADLTPVPTNYALQWMGGPGRENGDHPEYPGLAYYCDVSASLRLRENVPGAFVARTGMKARPEWTQIRISKRVLDRVRNPRSPRWCVWRSLGAVRVSEAVALSLDIEPRQLHASPHAWMTGRLGLPPVPLFDEEAPFQDRWFQAQRHFGSRGVPDPTVALSVFAAWARSVGWEMPSEMEALAVQQETAVEAPTPSEPPSEEATAAEAPETSGIAKFVRRYIVEQESAGSLPTKIRLEQAWKVGGYKGKRALLREEFNRQMGTTAPKQGRPTKSANKSPD